MLTMLDHELDLGEGLDESLIDKVFHRHALPLSVELGPPGHAVDVKGYLLSREAAELIPSPSSFFLDEIENVITYP